MQSTNNIFLVKPSNFGYNSETASSNAFQNKVSLDAKTISENVLNEFNEMVNILKEKGINVLVIEDTKQPIKPDAIFPNNWGSFHKDGTVILYPMQAENRRLEKRQDVLNLLQSKFEVKQVIDLSDYEKDNVYLEGTGSIIFDHNYKIAYACLSDRTNKKLFIETCENLGYKPIYFDSRDENGKAIYHTNVMLNIGNGYAVVCLQSIVNTSERNTVLESLRNSNKEIIDISYNQMKAFCGNMLELKTNDKKNLLVMSESAFNALEKNQKLLLDLHCDLTPINVNTIESIGGGSVRCMISEIFLDAKD